MGGDNSSYYSILAITGFFFAIWCSSKLSRTIGISSIVLEILTGLILSPQIVDLMPFQYAECFDDKVTDCDSAIDQAKIADQGDKWCDVHAYQKQGICDVPEYCSRRLATDVEHAISIAKVELDTRAVPSWRRLGGGGGGDPQYDSYSECLEKSCETELKENCSKTPDVFTLVGHTGVALMIFESGMHFDFEKAKVVGPWACIVAVLGTLLPLATGCLLIMAFGYDFYPDGVAAGTALAPTSVGIALRLLHEAQQLQSNFGQAIITAAFVDDILSLILFNVLFTLGDELTFMGTFFKPLMGILFMAVAMYLAMEKFPNALKTGLARFEGRATFPTKDQAMVFCMFALLVVYAQITHLCGTHLWGCFIAGMSFAVVKDAHDLWVKQTKRYTTWMIRIFFAATVAFAIPIDELGNPENIWKGAIMGIGPCILTKVLCAFFMGKPKWVIGWAMVGRAEFAYLIAQMAQSANMMEPATFSIVIWSLLWATVWAPLIFRFVLIRFTKQLAAEEAAKQGVEFNEDEFNAQTPTWTRGTTPGSVGKLSELHPPSSDEHERLRQIVEERDGELRRLSSRLAQYEAGETPKNNTTGLSNGAEESSKIVVAERDEPAQEEHARASEDPFTGV